jgi:hypothetical protein
MKQRVFISHIHEEHALGAVVAEWISEAFAGHPVQPFLSSDDKAIAAGQKWLDVVEHELGGTAVMVSLVSPASLARPWVNIELGAAWITKVAIIPFCHSGLSTAQLPRPFSDFQSIGLDQDNAATRLIEGLARHLGFPYSKKLHFADLLKEMRAAVAGIQASAVLPTPTRETKARDDLEPEEVQILKVLAEAANQGVESVPLTTVAVEAHLKRAAFSHYIDHLNKLRLVYVEYYANGDHEVRLQPDGAKWLMDRNAMPT